MQYANFNRSRLSSSATKKLDDDLDHSRSSTTSLLSSSSAKSKQRGTVRFGTIEIRQYNVIAGDNPDCRKGPAISLGWDYVNAEEKISVDDYECIANAVGRRHNETELYLQPRMRRYILKSWEIPGNEIREARNEKKRVQNERLETQRELYKMGVLKNNKLSLFNSIKKNMKKLHL